MVYSAAQGLLLLIQFFIQQVQISKACMIQNLAVVGWPVLMVAFSLIPVVMGLREYRRTR